MEIPGIVKSISGHVTATDTNGIVRTLQLGDLVYANEIISTDTSANTTILIEFDNGTTIDLAGNSIITLNNETLGFNTNSEQLQIANNQNDVSAIQQALVDTPNYDPTNNLPPTAAGNTAATGAGAENEGLSFININHIGGASTPSNDFDTIGINPLFPQPLEELILSPQAAELITEIVEPTIILALASDIGYIKEDSLDNIINLNVTVDDPTTDVLQTITISQLPADATLNLSRLTSAPEVNSFTGDGVNTPLVLILSDSATSFSSSFTLSPLEDSDIDITGISASAFAINADTPTLQASTTANLNIFVDAILDEQAHIFQDEEAFTNPSRASQTLALNLEFDMDKTPFTGSLAGEQDTDDSEKITLINITLSSGTETELILKDYNGNAKLQENQNSDNSYILTDHSDLSDLESAINSLAIQLPSKYAGEISGIIQTITQDNKDNGALEPDSSDNIVVGNFDFYALISDKTFDVTNVIDAPDGSFLSFRTTGSTLSINSSEGDDIPFNLDFSQLISFNNRSQLTLNDINTINISGNTALLEDNTFSLSAQDLLDFDNLNPQQTLTIEGNLGDQVRLIDQDSSTGAGDWALSNDTNSHTNTYSYIENGSIIANIIIEDSLTVNQLS